MEVNRVHEADETSEPAVNKVHRLEALPLEMAKAGMGGAIRKAIGEAPLKTYGPKSLLSEVCSGEKVPDYLARIWQDRKARRRLAKALVSDDSGVVVTTVMSFREDDEKVG